MNVHMVDLAAQITPLKAELMAAMCGVVESARFTLGPWVERFEVALAAELGCGHAVGMSSGTDALLATLMAVGVGSGTTVVTTPLSFFATAGAIVRLGARPVFADIELATFNMDPRAAAAAVDRTTRAVLPVHLFGRRAALPDVPVPVIEDAAQAIGTVVAGAAACVSFFPTKNLGAFGDGGAVLTNDVGLAERLRALRAHGAREKYVHDVVGGNFRLDALQAAILGVELPYLRAWNAARRANAARYRMLFAASRIPPELVLPADTADHVYHHFCILAPRRDALRARLAEADIETAVHYPTPLHLQPALAAQGYRRGAFPASEAAAEQILALPIHPSLSAAQQEYVVAEIAKFYQSQYT